MAERLKVVFLWHMHQPYYKDYFTGQYTLPWVRLHGIKDYLDMVSILDDFPNIKQTFNYVPSLLKQLDDYINNDAVDRHLVLSQKKCTDLSESDKIEILNSFFSANYKTMIKPYPEYNRLYHTVMQYRDNLGKAAEIFTEQEYCDLTVLANLVWIDPVFRNKSEIKPLYEKSKNYTYEEREILLNYQKKILKQIVPKLKEVQDRGQIEISFSPYYHPILPLLIDTDLAKEAIPRITLPENRFTHPEDAREQIQRSVDLYKNMFGKELQGMWPSEGSVAEKLLPILSEAGIKWIATDEEIFFHSVNHPGSGSVRSDIGQNFQRPFKLSRDFGEIGIIFRDHRLSDRIGFVYSTWDPEKAAADFINQLASIRTLITPSQISEHVIPIILDGENAWEYYQNDGRDFLELLYRKLSDDERFQTVTVSELFDDRDNKKNIPYLFAGSWIGHNFKIWIGHQEDNRAWDLLSNTRNALVEYQEKNPDADPQKIETAWEEIYIAEGSDWCWWYGEEHSSAEDDLFDIIFRSHLSAVYSLIGQEAPGELLEPVRTAAAQTAIIEPSNFFTPQIDGERSHFYEWYDAGSFNCRKAGSTMHRAANVMNEIFFGFDKDNLYFRFDLFTLADDEIFVDYLFELELRTLKIYRLTIAHDFIKYEVREDENDKFKETVFKGQTALKNVVEISFPRTQIELNDKFDVNLRVRVFKSDQLLETWPAMNLISFQAPTEDHSVFWQV